MTDFFFVDGDWGEGKLHRVVVGCIQHLGGNHCLSIRDLLYSNEYVASC